MEDNTYMDNFEAYTEPEMVTTEEKVYNSKPKKRNRLKNNFDYKIEKCKILAFNPKEKTLDIDFKNYGVRISNVSNIIDNDFIEVKYWSEIGKPDFKVEL